MLKSKMSIKPLNVLPSILIIINPFQNDKFKISKQKEFANDNSKFYENGRKYSIKVENSERKGEIPHHKQFLLFSWCFKKKNCIADT